MADVHAETEAPRIAGDSLVPPIERIGALRWLKENLFSSPLNSALTLLCLYVLWVIIPPILNWAIFNATLAGESREACADSTGACCGGTRYSTSSTGCWRARVLTPP